MKTIKLFTCLVIVIALTGVSYPAPSDAATFNSLDRRLTITGVDASFTEALVEVRYATAEADLAAASWEPLGHGALTLASGWGQDQFVFVEQSTLFFAEWRYSVDGGETWCAHPETITFDMRNKCGSSQID
jgi:hypothetical protein